MAAAAPKKWLKEAKGSILVKATVEEVVVSIVHFDGNNYPSTHFVKWDYMNKDDEKVNYGIFAEGLKVKAEVHRTICCCKKLQVEVDLEVKELNKFTADEIVYTVAMTSKKSGSSQVMFTGEMERTIKKDGENVCITDHMRVSEVNGMPMKLKGKGLMQSQIAGRLLVFREECQKYQDYTADRTQRMAMGTSALRVLGPPKKYGTSESVAEAVAFYAKALAAAPAEGGADADNAAV